MNSTTITQLELNNALRLSLFFPLLLFLVHSNNRRRVKINQQLSCSILSAFWCMCALFSFSCRWLLPLSDSFVPLSLRSRLGGSTERRLDSCLTPSSLPTLALSLAQTYSFLFSHLRVGFSVFPVKTCQSSPVGPFRLSLSLALINDVLFNWKYQA